MRTQILLVLLLSPFLFLAQASSSGQLRWTGIKISSSVVLASGKNNLSLEEHKKIITDDQRLYTDFSGYQKLSQENKYYQGLFALRSYFQITKKQNAEILIGVITGEDIFSDLGYIRKEYFSKVGLPGYFEVTQQHYYYGFSVSGRLYYLPMGINFSTNKKKHVWCSIGFEAAPGIAKYTFVSVNRRIETTVVSQSPVPVEESFEVARNSDRKVYFVGQSKLPIAGNGFAGYLSIPFNANLRFSNSKPILKNIHLHAGASALIYYSQHKLLGSRYGAGCSLEIGARFEW